LKRSEESLVKRLALALLMVSLTSLASAADWPQFRGPNGNGLAPDNASYPEKIGPETGIIWKTKLPPGHASPVVVGDRIFTTAVGEGKKLLTIGMDRASGKILWQSEAPYQKLEKIHTIGSFAQSTPVSNGEVVISFFGSSGIYAYDRDGKLLWTKPFGPFANDFGAGSSPLIVGNKVILAQDHDNGSFLMAMDIKTGEPLWKVDRSEFPRSYATPLIWEQAGKKQIVVIGTLRGVAYDLETGSEIWSVRGLSRIINMSPLIGPDGWLYVAAWSPGGDAGERIEVGTWAEMVSKHDKNNDTLLSEDEVPAGPIKMRFSQVDRNKDLFIEQKEYESMRRVFTEAQNRMIAIRPGGKGDITDSHVAWSMDSGKYLPYIPSPLIVGEHLFTVKNGGLFTSFERKSGKMIKNDRINGSANYYASPVAADGKIYCLSERGHLSVIKADGEWDIVHQAKFPDDVYATPALVDGRIYLRTNGYLYCFGMMDK